MEGRIRESIWQRNRATSRLSDIQSHPNIRGDDMSEEYLIRWFAIYLFGGAGILLAMAGVAYLWERICKRM
jgi:hypothetical protein